MAKPPRYVVYVDGGPVNRADTRELAVGEAGRRSIQGRHGHRVAVKDTHTGRWVYDLDNRIGEARTRPGHPQGRAQRKGILARLSRRNGRRRYRSR